MMGQVYLPIEHSRPRDFFEQLRPPNEQVARMPAAVERFHEQFEQFRVHHQQLEKHAPQTIGFDEPDELVQRGVGIRRAFEPAKKKRAQVAQHLARSRRDMKSTRRFRQVRQRFGGCLSIAKNSQVFSRSFGRTRRFGDYAAEDRPHLPHVFAQGGVEFFGRRKTEAA